MINRIEDGKLPAGTTIRIGVPAERPEQAIDALVNFLAEKDNVVLLVWGLWRFSTRTGGQNLRTRWGFSVRSPSVRQSSRRLRRYKVFLLVVGQFPLCLPPVNTFPKTLSSSFVKLRSANSFQTGRECTTEFAHHITDNTDLE